MPGFSKHWEPKDKHGMTSVPKKLTASYLSDKISSKKAKLIEIQ